MKTIQTTLAIILLTLAGQAMALTPVRANPISKATELFCKSVESKNYEMMDTLLAQGADVNGVCSFGYNGSGGHVQPLLFAVTERGRYGNRDSGDMVAYLLDHGAAINARSEQGDTPLIAAVDLFGKNPEESVRLVESFIAKGAKISIADGAGYTAFEHQAAKGYVPQTVGFWQSNFQRLLGKGVDINRQDSKGENALMRAARSCGSISVEMLLQNGANPALKNKKGSTAADIALETAASSSQGGCNNVVRVLANPSIARK